jgi:hypothetical protein
MRQSFSFYFSPHLTLAPYILRSQRSTSSSPLPNTILTQNPRNSFDAKDTPSMTHKDEEEWEYEYDENETEDFYIPIDLSNVPNAQIPLNAERRPGHPTLLKSRLRALNAARGQLPDTTGDSTATQDGTQEMASMGEVQIMGLHTSNPLMMYNGQLLSCQWTSTIGTDMFFTRPQMDDSDLHQPLRSLPAVDLLSLGTAKLIARVGRLRPRDDLFKNDEQTQPGIAAVDDARQVKDAAIVPPSTAAEDPKPAFSSAMPASTDFLARLNEAKARRGETSRLTVARTPDGSRLVSEPVNIVAQAGPDSLSHSTGDVAMGGT